MRSNGIEDRHAHRPGFRHEAVFYGGENEFLSATGGFVKDAIAADEPILVAVSARKIELLEGHLNGNAAKVRFVDMDRLGQNPARIIPAWRDFVAEHAGSAQPLRGIGEPVWPGRSNAEIVECERHEWLLNLAFGDGRPWWLLCPYDAANLEPEVIEAARVTHPYVTRDGTSAASGQYRDPRESSDPFAHPLPPPRGEPDELRFAFAQLRAVRAFVRDHAREAGLDRRRTDELVLAVNELATNSLRHAHGHGTARIWREPGVLLCEVRDEGHVADPLVGRRTPEAADHSGRGLWLANQLCDLVQIRSRPEGTTIRLHVRTAPAGLAPTPSRLP